MNWRTMYLDVIVVAASLTTITFNYSWLFGIPFSNIALFVAYLVLRDKTKTFTKAPTLNDIIMAVAISIGSVILANILELVF